MLAPGALASAAGAVGLGPRLNIGAPATIAVLNPPNGAAFVALRVKPDDPPPYKRDLDPASCRIRFPNALLGAG